MKAEDFYTEYKGKKQFTKLTNTGISPDYKTIFEFAEKYADSKVKNNVSLGCVSESYKRPKTVGELLDLLKEGIKCEVAANAEKITSIKLDGWLNFENKYKTKISKNKGWVIYEAV